MNPESRDPWVFCPLLVTSCKNSVSNQRIAWFVQTKEQKLSSAAPCIRCVILRKWQSLQAEPQLLQLSNRNDGSYPTNLSWGLNEITCIRYLAESRERTTECYWEPSPLYQPGMGICFQGLLQSGLIPGKCLLVPPSSHSASPPWCDEPVRAQWGLPRNQLHWLPAVRQVNRQPHLLSPRTLEFHVSACFLSTCCREKVNSDSMLETFSLTCFYYYSHTQWLAWRTLTLCLTVN